MIAVAVAICIVLFIIGCIFSARDYEVLGNMLSSFAFIVLLMFLVVGAIRVEDLKFGELVIDKKIAILEERNGDIESELSAMALGYITYEKEAYESFTNTAKENPIAFINIVPELSSNEVVKEQMDIYAENRQQIIALMTSKAELKYLPWYLYFGKIE